jgi:hypothetical protein
VPIFIDESGDTGFEEHSSKFFHIAALWVARDEVDPFRDAIAMIRHGAGLKATHEFKYTWSSNHPEHRNALIGLIPNFGGIVATCSINKSTIEWKGQTGFEIIRHAIESVFRSLAPVIETADSVTIDNNDDPQYLALTKLITREMDSTLKRPRIRKVRFWNSKSDSLLQVADVICGITADGYADPMLCKMLESVRIGA